ncbi:uncharacterized protein [Apostichopus japonicus]|uniref:uncharacterized protein isoform X2 n=1 Tax=Stichopus japonicus TaxID=307972 RepID=UPI003AB7D456
MVVGIGLMKYGKSVLLKVCQSMKRKDEDFSWAVDEMQGQRDEQNATAVAAVLGIPLLLKEKIKSFLIFADESNEDPQASTSGEMVPLMENQPALQYLLMGKKLDLAVC